MIKDRNERNLQETAHFFIGKEKIIWYNIRMRKTANVCIIIHAIYIYIQDGRNEDVN